MVKSFIGLNYGRMTIFLHEANGILCIFYVITSHGTTSHPLDNFPANKKVDEVKKKCGLK